MGHAWRHFRIAAAIVMALEGLCSVALGAVPAIVAGCAPQGTGIARGESAHRDGVPAVNVNDTSTTTVTWNMQTGGQGSSSATAHAANGTNYSSSGSQSSGGWDTGTFTVPAGTDIEYIDFTYTAVTGVFTKRMYLNE